MTMTCEQCQGNCLEYDSLSTDSRNATNQHLVDCPSCNREFTMMKELITMADDFKIDIPSDFSDRVMAGISQEKEESREMLPMWLIPVMAVSALIATAYLFVSETISSWYGELSLLTAVAFIR